MNLHLREEFEKLWNRCNLKGNYITSFNSWLDIHSDVNRYYHNWKHIKHCLEELEEFYLFTNEINQSDELRFAIWFHDIVYEIESNRNEYYSAITFMDFCISIGLYDFNFYNTTCHYISCTNLNKNFIPYSYNEKLICDIDLSILGSDLVTFKEYEDNIRREYKSVPDNVFNYKRKEILKSFLNQNRIFKTDYFYNKYESKARKNLENSIINLTF